MLEKAGITNFLTPENAVEAMSFLVRFKQHQAMLLESVTAFAGMGLQEASAAVAKATAIREAALNEQRTLLTELEAKSLLAAFGLPVNAGELATTRDEAQAAAKSMGFPVVMKIVSADITHKSDVGGVRLNLVNTKQVGNAFDDMIEDVTQAQPEARIRGVNIQPMMKFAHQREVLVGLKRDAVFGPVIAFGAGVSPSKRCVIWRSRCHHLNPSLAATLMRATRMRAVLDAYRDVPAIDRRRHYRRSGTRLDDRVSAAVDCGDGFEPGAGASGRRIGGGCAHHHRSEAAHRRSSLSPHGDFSLPDRAGAAVRLKDGSALLMRPIRPDDAGREQAFVAELSPKSRYYAFPVSGFRTFAGNDRALYAA